MYVIKLALGYLLELILGFNTYGNIPASTGQNHKLELTDNV